MAALFRPEKDQHITVQTVGLLAMGWLPWHLPEFECAHPSVRVHILTANLNTEFRTITADREPDIQIAFGSASEFPESALRLFGERISVVASAELAARIKSPADLKGVRLYDVVSHQSGWHQMLNTPAASGLQGVEIVMVDNTQTALLMATAGNGLALARAPASDGLVQSLGLTACSELPAIKGLQHYYLMIPEARRLNPAAAAFRNWISSMAHHT